MTLYQWWCHLPMHLAMAWAIGFMLVVVWMIAWLIKRADPLEQEKRAIRKKRKGASPRAQRTSHLRQDAGVLARLQRDPQMNAQISDLDTLVESPLDLALAEQTIALAKLKATWLAARDIFDPALNALVKAGIEPRFDATYCSVNFAGDKDKLLKVVRILVAAGFRMPTERPKAGDTSWYGHFSHPDTALSFFLNFTSSVCKRVKVGTKTVEQDVFETRCGDDLGAVEFAPAAAAPAIAEEILF